MTSIAYSPVSIQTSSQAAPLPPPWFGQVVLIMAHLRKQGVLDAITQRVRFARRRFGRYEVIDFVAVLFGYAISGERTLEAFYQAVLPWAESFTALFGRTRLPARSTLSRFLSALTPEPVEALRSLFLADLLARPLGNEHQIGGLVDRAGRERVVFDIDGTREAARQRALPQTADRPAAQRRMTQVCAPGYTGRKRGEVVRTRTTVSQTHSYQWLGEARQPWQWPIPGGTAPRSSRDRMLFASAPAPAGTRPAAAGWAVWHKSHHRFPRRLLVRDAGQRLSGA
jgi:hypothetical protein